MSLSNTERLILANQYRILELLDPQNVADHSQSRDAIERGYVAAYPNLLSEDENPEFPLEESSFVVKALSMFDAMQRSFKNLGSVPGVKPQDVAFDGFDGNNETTYMAYARFVVDQENRFDYLTFGGDRLNSLTPRVTAYRGMLRKWIEMDESYELSAEQIRALIEAQHQRNQ